MVHAQTIMTANVPFAFSVGQSQLPAGSYAVREVGDRATLIQSKDGKDHVLGIYPMPDRPRPMRRSWSSRRLAIATS